MIFSYISFETLEFQLNTFNISFFVLLFVLSRLIPKPHHPLMFLTSGIFFVYHYSPISLYLLIPFSLLLAYYPVRYRLADYSKAPLWFLGWALYFLALSHEDFHHYAHTDMFQFETLVLGCYNFMRGYNIFYELWVKKARYSFQETLGFFWHGPVLFSGPLETLDEWAEYYRKKRMPIFWKKGIKLIGSSFGLSLIAEVLFVYATPQALDFDSAPYLRVLIYAYAIVFVVHFRVASYINFTRGFSTLMGYPFAKPNFDRPYNVRSVASFWTRWHMSIARWARDYVLFRNFAKFEGKRFLATVLIYFTVVGIGHGWAYNYVLWGTTQGAAIVLNFIYLFAKYKIPTLLLWDQKLFPIWFKRILTLAYIHITWVLLDPNWEEIFNKLF
jgi:D-alanyl-lipoteichoic acid acyltransferase DltB (MBOAT superfamily)